MAGGIMDDTSSRERPKVSSNRWDNFTPWELQALDEFFRSFGPMRNSNPDIGKLGEEVAAAIQRRSIEPFGPSDHAPAKVKSATGPGNP